MINICLNVKNAIKGHLLETRLHKKQNIAILTDSWIISMSHEAYVKYAVNMHTTVNHQQITRNIVSIISQMIILV